MPIYEHGATFAGKPVIDWEPGVPLADRLVAGAVESGLAEHWNPDTGRALGAVPQSWAGLAVVVSPGGGSPV